MKSKVLIASRIICISSFIAISCNNEKASVNSENEYYCKMIDTIIFKYNNRESNLYLTQNLDAISAKAGISDNAHKGTSGIIYSSDSLFFSDMARFKSALECVSK